ncbi:MAG TPA: 2-oxoacid:ferredoxin oxidoreductase subunit beta, partial [Chloroflexota bacterium]|nr:2-oxoacid:ferredoxin oxidoreductase subunit beta [Chloroflexota bacterium]
KATQADFVPLAREIRATIPPDGVTRVAMHDRSIVQFRSVPEGYDPSNRQSVLTYLQEQQSRGEIVTGLLYLDESVGDLHETNNTSAVPLAQVPYEQLCPGATELARLQEGFR